MTSFGGHIHLVENVEDVAKLQRGDPSQLAFVTQTTLSVDDTAEIVDALRAAFPCARDSAQGRHLLRHPEPAGLGEEAAGAV